MHTPTGTATSTRWPGAGVAPALRGRSSGEPSGRPHRPGAAGAGREGAPVRPGAASPFPVPAVGDVGDAAAFDATG
ncbi:hypothetical protein PUR61_23760 [Streptomyces sp. BE20]|uniref:hypothetical protein n=1 Tax=Streptomycetaceae TaxID=2062 RepID=UPI002E78B5AB|nr:hypothetical protein [Streptomyces sp. BE20]MEE1825176.1 hypothetical protein [Streptomyces sp. BE20]